MWRCHRLCPVDGRSLGMDDARSVTLERVPPVLMRDPNLMRHIMENITTFGGYIEKMGVVRRWRA